MENQKKNNPLKTVITIAISVAVAVFFMWLAFRGLEFDKIRGYFAKANYLWVAAAAVFGILAYWFRAIRWNLLFEPMGYSISNSNSFWSISFGYLMNLTIPRSGEVARATALYGVEKVPVDKSFGTIILERVVDLICMIGFLGLTLIFKYDAIKKFVDYALNQKNDQKAEMGILDKFLLNIGITDVDNFYFLLKIAIVVSVLAGLIWLFVKKREQLVGFIKGIFEGLLSIFKLKQPVKFLLYSAAIWICYYLAAYLICFALPETSNFTVADGFFIIVVGTLGMMIPASGGIGAFHLALKLGIGALFLSMGKTFAEGEEVGLAYAFISHTMQLVIMAVLGFISIPILAKARNEVTKKESYQ